MPNRTTEPETPEPSIERRARAGDRRALGELLRSHDHAMRAVAWRMLGDRDLVDDVLQDAYLKVHRSVERFRGESAFGTWLHRIVVNTCVDHLRRIAKRNEVSLTPEVEPLVGPPEDNLSDSERIRQALLALPDEQRVAILLVDCEGYSYDEVASILGITPGAVGSRLFRARAKLQAFEEDER